MNKSKASTKRARANQSRQRNNENQNPNQRSDYHVNYESQSSDSDTEDLLVFEWSKVIPIYNVQHQEIIVHKAEIDVDHMKTETKGPRGRPLQSWEFIFSPAKFDREVGLE